MLAFSKVFKVEIVESNYVRYFDGAYQPIVCVRKLEILLYIEFHLSD